jgi:hypothetical protein
MNSIKKGLIYLAAILAGTFMTSCEKDNTLQYNNATMGNMVDGIFVSDQGNRFNIVDQRCDGQLDEMKRAFIVCDVLNKSAGGGENDYDVRLNHIASVLTKDVVLHTDVTEEMIIQDPIHIENAWISGGYINMVIMFPSKVGSSTSHLINLVHEGGMTDQQTKEEIAGTYRFTLRHNSFEDKISTQPADYVMAGGYVSFPLSTYITEKEADFSIEWTSHISVGAGLSSETEVKSLKGKYTSDGFQHAPQNPAVQTMAIVE